MSHLYMIKHVCPNVKGGNQILSGLYDEHKSRDITVDHIRMAGALYNVVRSNPQFLTDVVGENPNILWSFLTLLTYYLIRFAKREIESSVGRNENLVAVRAPNVLVDTWYELVRRLGQRLGRAVTWYDLLYANNYEEVDGKIEPLLSVSCGTDVNEVNFLRAMTIMGGISLPDRIQQYFQNYTDEHYFDVEFFNAYYVRYFNWLGRIRGLDGGQLNTISCMLPVPQLNVHFDVTHPQESRLFQSSVPS